MFLRLTRSVLATVFVTTVLAASGLAQGVKRVVILKIDGLPGYYLDSVVKSRETKTGKSILPWVEEVFYKNGTRVPNFYTRGMSLSGPSWGQLDTGQHAQIKGNVEFDRFTLHSYDYLNFVPYYLDYGRSKKVDMPATEVMDQLKIPLLSDAFAADKKYTAQQLYQRGYDWAVLASGFVNMFPRDTGDLIDEWTIGFNFRKMTLKQVQRDIEGKLVKRNDIDYFDYYDTEFDHVSHGNNDAESRLVPLRELDRTVGRIWSAIASSSRADETALVLVSDHGFNSDEKVYSQGFNIVKLLAERAGGAHHVVTKRRLMLNYSLRGVNPLVPLVRTSSKDSYYLKAKSNVYPTAVVDFDGNERASIHLRNSDINVIHILMQELRGRTLKDRALRASAADAILATIDKHRTHWRTTVRELDEELDALARWVADEQKAIAGMPMSAGSGVSRLDAEDNRRRREQINVTAAAAEDYRKYKRSLSNLLELDRDVLIFDKFKIEDHIVPDAMGDANTIYDLQNYVVGLAEKGIVVDADGKLDLAKSFERVNYFELLLSQRVRNNVQRGVGNKPVDLVCEFIPSGSLKNSLPGDLATDEDAVWLYGGSGKQALILTRIVDGQRFFRYLPVADLAQDADGKITFERREIGDGLPLKYFEDANLNISGDKIEWLNGWHSEIDWLRVVHKTTYSNAIIGVNEQLKRHRLITADGESRDDALIRRFRQRQRLLAEADLFVLANDHWNFDVRGFNPGGNHGSFLRVATNSTFMIAGGAKTGIPRALVVTEPYDSLSFVPTILRLMGKIEDDGSLSLALRESGFHKFPGRIITEITAR